MIHLRPELRPQEFVFFEEKMGERFKKANSWGLSPGLKCVKMDLNIFKKNNHVAHSTPDGRLRKKIKSKKRPGSSGILNFNMH